MSFKSSKNQFVAWSAIAAVAVMAITFLLLRPNGSIRDQSAKTLVELAAILGVTRRTLTTLQKIEGFSKPLSNGL